MNLTNHFIQEPLVLTRYLYRKLDVKYSLLIALLEKDENASLFWIYELYYSGFREECFEYLLLIYSEIYIHTTPHINKYIHECYTVWFENEDSVENDCLIGNIAYTIAWSEYNLTPFVKMFYNRDITTSNILDLRRAIHLVHLEPRHILKYQTHEPPNENENIDKYRAYNTLQEITLLPIHNEIHHLFDFDGAPNVHNTQTLWLYYASKSPVWKQRIQEYNGIVCNNDRSVLFDDEDDEEQFYHLWHYEPDEIPTTILNKLIGSDETQQINVDDFCEKYDYTITQKKKKYVINKDKKLISSQKI